MKNLLNGYNQLIDNFITGIISPEEFRLKYIELWVSWRNEPPLPKDIEVILNELHSDCDVYWSDSELGDDQREKWMLNAEDLLSSAKLAKVRLSEALKKTHF